MLVVSSFEFRKVLPATGVTWALQAQSGSKSPKWVSRSSRPRQPKKSQTELQKGQNSRKVADFDSFSSPLLDSMERRAGRPRNSFRTPFATLGPKVTILATIWRGAEVLTWKSAEKVLRKVPAWNGCRGKCRKKCSGLRLLYYFHSKTEPGALFSALPSVFFLFWAGTFWSTLSALFQVGASAPLEMVAKIASQRA